MMCEPSSENIPNLIKNQVNKMEREYRETVDVTKRETSKVSNVNGYKEARFNDGNSTPRLRFIYCR